MSTNFLSPGWRMPTDANQSKLANYSLYQPDQSDYIESSYSINNLIEITVSCWIKTTTSQPNEHIWSAPKSGTGSGLALQFGTGVGVGFKCENYAMASIFSVSDTSFVYNDGEWHNIIITSSLTQMKMHIDGVLKDTTSITATAMSGTIDKFFIGSFTNSNPGFNSSNLYFSDLCIFDYALNQSQVAAIYGDGSSIPNPMALASSPVAYYPLGTSAWNGQYLVENNAIGNYVFNFSSSQEINCGSNASLNQVGSVFTMSCWINTTSNARGCIMGTYNSTLPKNYTGYYIDLMGNGTVQGGYHQGVQYYLRGSNSSVRDGRWHHVCYVSSSAADGYLNVYIDGVLDQNALQSSTPPPANANSTDPFKINSAGYIARYIGKTSNVQVFSTALSATEVETLYNYGSPLRTLASIPQNSNLKGWWKLDASASFIAGTWAIPDDSGNGNGGASTGMTQANLIQSDLQTGASYSSYAMNFSGVSTWVNVVDAMQNSFPSNSIYTISTWFQYQPDTGCMWGGPIASNFFIYILNQTKLRIGKRGTTGSTDISYSFVVGDWINIVMVFDSTANVKIYIDNVFIQDVTIGPNTNMTGDFKIAGGLGAYPLACKQSNFSIWEDALTSAQVTEIYNQGLPSDLRSHSAYSSLINWWELGGNSSFNIDGVSGATGVGIVLDEMGNINGDSTANVTLTNGVGTTANGLSVNMAVGNLLGNAPYSTANSLSTNMAVTVKVSGVSDATITTGGTGYTTGTNTATTGGTGTNCTINITTVSGGAITALTIISGGINYVIGDVLTIPGGNGNATITVSGLNTP